MSPVRDRSALWVTRAAIALLALLIGAAVGAAVASGKQDDDTSLQDDVVVIVDADSDRKPAQIPVDALPAPGEWPSLDGVQWVFPQGQDSVMTPVAAGVKGLSSSPSSGSDSPTIWSEISAARWRADQWLTAAQTCANDDEECLFQVVAGPRELSFGGVEVTPVLTVDPQAAKCEGWLNLAADAAPTSDGDAMLRWLVRGSQSGSLLVELIEESGPTISATANLSGPTGEASLGDAMCIGIESIPGEARTVRFRFVGDEGAVDVTEMTSVALDSHTPAVLSAVRTDEGMVVGVLQSVSPLEIQLSGSSIPAAEAVVGSAEPVSSQSTCPQNPVAELPEAGVGPDRWWVQRLGVQSASLPEVATDEEQPATPIRGLSIAVPTSKAAAFCARIDGSTYRATILDEHAVADVQSKGELSIVPGEGLSDRPLVVELLSPAGLPLCVVSWNQTQARGDGQASGPAEPATVAPPTTETSTGVGSRETQAGDVQDAAEEAIIRGICPIGDDLGLWATGGEQVGWIAVSVDGGQATLTGLRWGGDPSVPLEIQVTGGDCEPANACALSVSWVSRTD